MNGRNCGPGSLGDGANREGGPPDGGAGGSGAVRGGRCSPGDGAKREGGPPDGAPGGSFEARRIRALTVTIGSWAQAGAARDAARKRTTSRPSSGPRIARRRFRALWRRDITVPTGQ